MSLFIIGGVRCQLAPFNIDEIEDESEMQFARHRVLGARVSHERTADHDQKLELQGSIFPKHEKLDGRPELTLLEGIHALGMPILVLRGEAKLGWYVITRLRRSHTYLDGSGTGRKIRIQISLEATQKPISFGAAIDFFMRLSNYV